MENVQLPDKVNENTKICRICLKGDADLQSIWKMVNACSIDRSVQIVDILADCTSIEVGNE